MLALLLSSAAPAEGAAIRCQKYWSRVLQKPVEYCIQRTQPGQDSRGEPVVYYMHGIFGTARRWQSNHYDETLDQLVRREGFPALSVVTFETSALSYFIDRKDGLPFQRWFIEEFIPHIESTTGVCSSRECRGVIGNSMGGLGALHTALRFPRLFGLVAVNSPALLPFNIFEPWKDWVGYLDRHPISRLQGRFFLRDSRRAFGTRENFNEHDPAWIIAHRWEASEPLPELFMDAGGQDFWGFFEGFFRMKSALESRGLDFVARFEPTGVHKIELQPNRRERLLRFVRHYLERRLRARSSEMARSP